MPGSAVSSSSRSRSGCAWQPISSASPAASPRPERRLAMQVKPQQADALVKSPPAALRALLLYGPDGGLVRERARSARVAVLGAADDPFRLTELTGGNLKDDPTRLADEAAALSFTGGRRVVSLRDVGEAQLGTIQAFLKELPGDALVIVEAGDLPKRSALVKAFEAAGPEA